MPDIVATILEKIDNAAAFVGDVTPISVSENGKQVANPNVLIELGYSRTFSLAELKDIDAFAHTPSGGHYLSQSLALVGDPDVAKVNAAAFAEIRSVTDALVPGFKDKLIAYVKAHPDLAAEIKAEDKPQ